MLFLELVQLYFRKKKVLARVKSSLTASDWYTGFQPGFFACAMTAHRQRQQVSSLPVFNGFQTWSGHHHAVTNAPWLGDADRPNLHFEEPQGK